MLKRWATGRTVPGCRVGNIEGNRLGPALSGHLGFIGLRDLGFRALGFGASGLLRSLGCGVAGLYRAEVWTRLCIGSEGSVKGYNV